tara:strand:+ start:157 stop:585 length:429 start_codon:yes stop_codon:yes gene_type:complete
MKYKQTHEYKEKGVRYMRCQAGCCYIQVGDTTTAVRCSREVNAVIAKMFPNENKPSRVKTGRPAGWHWMAEFVDKDGKVYHRGKEQPKLKGTRPITVVKPKKQTKRRTQEQILLAREKEKKAALRKEFKKQKEFLNHKLLEK